MLHWEPMEAKENVSLKAYTTFRMGGDAAYFSSLKTTEDAAECARFAKEKALPLIILGGGSNVIVNDEIKLNACVGHMEIQGFEIVSEDENHTEIKIGAGEEWDSVVERTVSLGLSGVEALSAIPGSAGATPVQNVGAYGQEIADTFVNLLAYDTKMAKVIEISKEECKFSYRDSIFKHEGKDRYIILSITLRLSKSAPTVPAYPGVDAYFKSRGVASPSLKEIREAIIEIRKHKLPDPKTLASCGSFFKNPIVDKVEADRIKNAHPNAVIYPVSDTTSKIGAGWMIDTLGLKGKDFGNILVYPQNALVLVNKGDASKKELMEAVEYITGEAQKAFGITLEPEPVFVN
jgi:UDP-N-acetylmuramate dehydrogenase